MMVTERHFFVKNYYAGARLKDEIAERAKITIPKFGNFNTILPGHAVDNSYYRRLTRSRFGIRSIIR